ncbi:hypothetical protein DFP72DRAFT_847311 [Ephemerocybe angulata]|uniref:Uncharacterized protein n=1 Tax=Ephemerocybe angulata TaxID=980116 RepID=A0A8H6I015_9AGAR|nr:hypothetical protein DFP72DRAFT_847311 [Tulosesus angulatus]
MLLSLICRDSSVDGVLVEVTLAATRSSPRFPFELIIAARYCVARWIGASRHPDAPVGVVSLVEAFPSFSSVVDIIIIICVWLDPSGLSISESPHSNVYYVHMCFVTFFPFRHPSATLTPLCPSLHGARRRRRRRLPSTPQATVTIALALIQPLEKPSPFRQGGWRENGFLTVEDVPSSCFDIETCPFDVRGKPLGFPWVVTQGNTPGFSTQALWTANQGYPGENPVQVQQSLGDLKRIPGGIQWFPLGSLPRSVREHPALAQHRPAIAREYPAVTRGRLLGVWLTVSARPNGLVPWVPEMGNTAWVARYFRKKYCGNTM